MHSSIFTYRLWNYGMSTLISDFAALWHPTIWYYVLTRHGSCNPRRVRGRSATAASLAADSPRDVRCGHIPWCYMMKFNQYLLVIFTSHNKLNLTFPKPYCLESEIMLAIAVWNHWFMNALFLKTAKNRNFWYDMLFYFLQCHPAEHNLEHWFMF